MRWVCAGISFVNVATISGLILGIIARGLNHTNSATALLLGLIAAACAYFGTSESVGRADDNSGAEGLEDAFPDCPAAAPGSKYRHIWIWILSACFAIYACRSFCWLLYIEGDELKVQSPNNLGDLALHLTYIHNFARGAALWPDNPIFVFSKLRYPAGIDLFNGLFTCLGFDTIRGLAWVGLIASAATCWALFRWAGAFGIAGFLFNGGIAGFQVLVSGKFLDYQGDKTIVWKSIPLAMFTTQRGFLYAIPAGLLLLCHWRSRFFQPATQPGNGPPRRTLILPFWVELSVYATMPLFHVHTFLALSIMLLFFFALGDMARIKHLALLAGSALLPATWIVWLITDHFQARSILDWEPGLLQQISDVRTPFFRFWFVNFGLTVPAMLAVLGICAWRAWRQRENGRFVWLPQLSFLAPATAILLLTCLVKTAPWAWDNTKLLIWAYLIFLPFIWNELIAGWPVPVRAGVCIALFASGFVSLIGGLATGREGFTIAERAELDAVGWAVRTLPIEARFAAYPTYNHPLLLQGRKVVLGYGGHLWTQGFDYASTSERLTTLMNGAADWQEAARFLRVRYLFWGRDEKTFYPASMRPWEQASRLVDSGSWGAIYDLASAPSELGD
ncbi:MAG: hypothetical protein ABI871_00735 [Chthoniobacterales bacterium]